MNALITKIDDIVWGVPLIVGILLVGIILTCSLRCLHLANLRRAFRYMFSEEDGSAGDVHPFAALCTALSATIGTGNIVGVATAIGAGGPGALFWMEVAAFFGMATKYAEGLLAVKYRVKTPDGKMLGGPFYYIENGMGKKWKWLACTFAIFGVLAAIMGIGTITQINGITSAVGNFFDPDKLHAVTIMGHSYSYAVVIAGIFVTLCTGLVVIGGLKRIAAVSTVVVPFMAIGYVVVCLLLILANLDKLTGAIALIVRSALNPSAVLGGAVGSIFIAMQKGIARGIFSNEAGLGSAPIAAAAAKTNEPARQGLVCMTGTFIDTIIICSMTGLAIVITGAWLPENNMHGVGITTFAFEHGLDFLPNAATFAKGFIMVALAFFAFTTILGWDYYSEKCLEYLVGTERQGLIKVYRFLYVAMVFVGPYLTLEAVWNMADIFNGLMALPNLIALVVLSPVVAKTTFDFIARKQCSQDKV